MVKKSRNHLPRTSVVKRQPQEKDIKKALEVLSRAADVFPNAGKELRNFLSHQEVLPYLSHRTHLRPDSGWPGRPDMVNSEGRPDSGSPEREDSGGLGRPD